MNYASRLIRQSAATLALIIATALGSGCVLATGAAAGLSGHSGHPGQSGGPVVRDSEGEIETARPPPATSEPSAEPALP